MTWNPNKTRNDEAIIDGVATPGTCHFPDLAKKRKFEKHDGNLGTAGGWIFWTGDLLADFKMIVRLYTEEHWDYWFDTMLPVLLKSPAGGGGHSLSHPIPAAYKIQAVVFPSVGVPKLNEKNGLWECEVVCTEFNRAKIDVAKIKKAQAATETAGAKSIRQLEGDLQGRVQKRNALLNQGGTGGQS